MIVSNLAPVKLTLTLFILMVYHLHIDTISMELSSLYFKGLPLKISIKLCIFAPEDCFFLTNSADPDKMPPYAAFYLGLYCLPKYLSSGIQNENGYFCEVCF